MPRKSAAAQAVVPLVTPRRLQAPPELTAQQRQTWEAVTSTKPPSWFTRGDAPLLAAFCQSVEQLGVVAGELNRWDPQWTARDDGLARYAKLLTLHQAQARTVAALARAMRLTQQSRLDRTTAGGQARRYPGGNPLWKRTFEDADEEKA
ncbi:MAG: hypothetical protein WKH97_02995 [Casimicrobiaceae bacterium]